MVHSILRRLWWSGTYIPKQLWSLPVPEGDFAGQTVIVTGANVGLGLEAARHFVRLGAARVILACRDVAKGDEARRDILGLGGDDGLQQQPAVGDAPAASVSESPAKAAVQTKTAAAAVVDVWQLDLASFESVRAFGHRCDAELDRLDVVVQSAGILTIEFEEAEGYERTTTVNVISTFLLALMLLPLMRRTAKEKKVQTHLTIVTSEAIWSAAFKERKLPAVFPSLKTDTYITDRYAVSKLLQVLFVRQLVVDMAASGKDGDASAAAASPDANPHHPVLVNCTNPGLCRTSLFRALPGWVQTIGGGIIILIGRTAEQGSRTLMAAATAGEESHGMYMSNCAVGDESPFITTEEADRVGRRAWEELKAILEGIEKGVTANI